MKHGRVICKECNKTMFQGRRPMNRTVTYSVCGECRRTIEIEKRKSK